MVRNYELEARFDSRKSFYKKATVVEDGDVKRLFSYKTHVATIKNDELIILGDYSATTQRHIKEFALQNGFKVGAKNEMLDMYFREEE